MGQATSVLSRSCQVRTQVQGLVECLEGVSLMLFTLYSQPNPLFSGFISKTNLKKHTVISACMVNFLSTFCLNRRMQSLSSIRSLEKYERQQRSVEWKGSVKT